MNENYPLLVSIHVRSTIVEHATPDKSYTVHRIIQGVDASSNLIYFKNDIDEISMVIEIYCELIE